MVQITPNQFWALVGVVCLILLAAAGLWLYAYKRLFRVKAIFILSVAFVASPGFKIAAKALDVDVDVPGPGWPAAFVVFVAINWLGALEWQSRKQDHQWSTSDAFAQYVEKLADGATKESRVKMLREFGKDDELPTEIFRMCQIAELLWPARRPASGSAGDHTERDS